MIVHIVLVSYDGDRVNSFANLTTFDFGRIVFELESYGLNVAYASSTDADGEFQATFTVMVPTYASEGMDELRAIVNDVFKSSFIGF